MKTTAICPVCGSDSLPEFCSGEYRMFRCVSCFLCFVHPMPTDESLQGFYSRFHKELREGGGYELVEDRMTTDFAAKISKIKTALPAGDVRLLDVGCGKGFFVKTCLDAGLQADGIDLSDTAIDYATKELGIRARCGRIEDLAGSMQLYDAVTFWATIEHLRDPLRTLSTIRRVLKPAGFLFLDTGIGDDWLDRLLPGFVQWYDPPQHLFVFSEKSMRIALYKAGFKVKDMDTCFERSTIRRITRILRGFVCAAGLRTVSGLTRLSADGLFQFTRFPLGNLMSVVARSGD